ncbi:MAG: hypothetical protein ABIK07_10800 [Planctomycetota bacterium]|jgi:CBS domain containing-hemolysin-like protein|uniref:hypothetical protein n=1 Tax=uncultured Gimesia sp. TaxID=1678688 RepID=UPI0026323F64|nr:hypothetical protein [uncultured Gimesia sp.]
MDRDQRHLKILSKVQIIFGITNLFVSYLYYKAIFILVDEYRKFLEQSNPEVEVALLLGFGFVIFLIGIVILFCIILAGQSLARFENYKFCFIVAAFECLMIPFGTIIGISTILILRRDSVKTLFENAKVQKDVS